LLDKNFEILSCDLTDLKIGVGLGTMAALLEGEEAEVSLSARHPHTAHIESQLLCLRASTFDHTAASWLWMDNLLRVNC
jgi:hypothetical protein